MITAILGRKDTARGSKGCGVVGGIKSAPEVSGGGTKGGKAEERWRRFRDTSMPLRHLFDGDANVRNFLRRFLAQSAAPPPLLRQRRQIPVLAPPLSPSTSGRALEFRHRLLPIVPSSTALFARQHCYLCQKCTLDRPSLTYVALSLPSPCIHRALSLSLSLSEALAALKCRSLIVQTSPLSSRLSMSPRSQLTSLRLAKHLLGSPLTTELKGGQLQLPRASTNETRLAKRISCCATLTKHEVHKGWQPPRKKFNHGRKVLVSTEEEGKLEMVKQRLGKQGEEIRERQ